MRGANDPLSTHGVCREIMHSSHSKQHARFNGSTNTSTLRRTIPLCSSEKPTKTGSICAMAVTARACFKYRLHKRAKRATLHCIACALVCTRFYVQGIFMTFFIFHKLKDALIPTAFGASIPTGHLSHH
jgi:hypothetical protein